MSDVEHEGDGLQEQNSSSEEFTYDEDDAVELVDVE
jgi:hypothetical protein